MTEDDEAGALDDAGPEVQSDQRQRDSGSRKAEQEATPDAAERHAEIKRRYARKWSSKLKPDRIKSVRRSQVLRLLRDRHGSNTLSDDAAGRTGLQLLFELGLDGPTAQTLAPWANNAEIERLIGAADANWHAWSTGPDDPTTIAEKIGARLEVTFDEFKRLGLTHIRPGDVPRHQVEKDISDCKAERDRLRKRSDRARAKQAKAPSDPWDLPDSRAKSLACAPLANRQWWSVRRLAEHAQEHLGSFDGLDYPAARQAVLRAVRLLKDLGIVETKTEIEQRGLNVLYARRPITAADIEAERQQLLEEVAAEQEAGQEVT